MTATRLDSKPVAQVITQRSPDSAATHWRYQEQAQLPFNPVVFDEQVLETRGMLTGTADAGRGNTYFLAFQGQPLVLRHYRRGGLVRHLLKDQYLYTGLARTRALREFDLLLWLHEQAIPAPIPYACRVVLSGLLYRASLVTYRLPGLTLAQRLSRSDSPPVSDQDWQHIGESIATLHAHGCWHADLNAHNILLADDGAVSLIDFDRARLRTVPAANAASGWCLDNIDRLERSLTRLASGPRGHTVGFATLKQCWQESLSAATLGP